MSAQFDPILGQMRDGAVTLAEQTAGFNMGTAAEKAAFQSSVSGASTAAFSAAVPLTGRLVMPQQTVGAVLTFTPAPSPKMFCSAYVRLIADGANAPVFSGGFTEWGGSAGYSNTAGILNFVTFWWDGVTYWYSVNQAASATPVVVPALSTAVIASGAPSQIVLTYSAALDTASVPAAGDFAISNTGGSDTVATVAVSGSTVTLTKSRATLGGDTVAITYTPGATPIRSSADKVNAAALASRAVTNQLGAVESFVRFSALTAVTESGDATAGYTYTSSAGFSTANAAGSDKSLQSGQDGYVRSTLLSVGNVNLVGFKTVNTSAVYNQFAYALYRGTSTAYQTVTNNTGAGTVNGTSLVPTAGDRLRIRRAGTTIYGEVSRDSGATWTIVHTWTSASTAQMWPGLNINTSLASGPVVGYNLS